MAHHTHYFPFFHPSTAGAAVVFVLFFLAFVVSTYQTVRSRAWVWFFMLLSIAMETVGYGTRIGSTKHTTNRDQYIVQFVLIILAPVFMAGVIYVAFGRIVFHVVPPAARTVRLLWVPARWLTPIFVGFDVLALLLQLIGAVIVASTQVTDHNAVSKLHTGKNVALAGVTLQIAAFGLFSIVAARFHFTSRRFVAELESRYTAAPGEKLVAIQGRGSDRRFRPKWRNLLYGINFACTMILVRSIYREVDFGMGKVGYTEKHEWVMYVFDAAPMLLLAITFILVPPGEYVAMAWRQRPKSERLAARNARAQALEPTAPVEELSEYA